MWLCSTECFSIWLLQLKHINITVQLWKFKYPVSLTKPVQPVTKAEFTCCYGYKDYEIGSTLRNKFPLSQHAFSFLWQVHISASDHDVKSIQGVGGCEGKWCEVALKGRLVHLNQYNMVQATLKRYSCWKVHVVCCPIMPIHSKFSSSIIRHFFCPSACGRGGAYNVLLLRLLMSPGFYPLHILTEFLYCCLSISVPHSFYSWANSFPFQAVWCSCLSLSVSLPLFWHLHAVKDRQTLYRHWQVVPRHKTGFDAVSGRLQNVWPTLYIKALWSLRSCKKQSEYFRWPKLGSHWCCKKYVVYLLYSRLVNKGYCITWCSGQVSNVTHSWIPFFIFLFYFFFKSYPFLLPLFIPASYTPSYVYIGHW